MIRNRSTLLPSRTPRSTSNARRGGDTPVRVAATTSNATTQVALVQTAAVTAVRSDTPATAKTSSTTIGGVAPFTIAHS